jgi:hypothetical protein
MRNADLVGKAFGHRARIGRRRPILRFVILALLLAALMEPLVMYLSLMRERAERRANVELSLRSPPLADGGAR